MFCSVSANYESFDRLVAVTINKSIGNGIREPIHCIEENDVLRYKKLRRILKRF